MLTTLMIWLAEPVVASLVKWGLGMAFTYFAAKPVIEKWGSTPNNRGAELGITSQDAHDYGQKDRKNKLKHLKEKVEEWNKEIKEENEKLKEDLKKLEQRLLKETEDWKDPTIDSAERARRLAIMQNTQKEIETARKQIKENNNTIKENEKKITDTYDELSEGARELTVQQLQDKNNRIDVGYWFNWIVVISCGILAVYLINWIFGWLDKMKKK